MSPRLRLTDRNLLRRAAPGVVMPSLSTSEMAQPQLHVLLAQHWDAILSDARPKCPDHRRLLQKTFRSSSGILQAFSKVFALARATFTSSVLDRVVSMGG